MNKPSMTPAPGERMVRFVGDTVAFELRGGENAQTPQTGWQAKLRTNLGRAELLRQEIIKAHFHRIPFAGASWRDLPMRWEQGGWKLALALAEVGYFKAKAYLIDPRGYQHWPDGPDFGISVHPDACRTGNTIYCAFPRLFGESKTQLATVDEKLEVLENKLDERGYTVIPPSGKLRDLVRELPHIFGTLGCRILQLLPVNPTPTTFARMGRFGSPYACGDLTAIDPALVEFDKRTTGVDQFCELARGVHQHGGKLFIDLVINHTGWDCPVREYHPEWYLRDSKGNFASPGAWGVVWADLVELEHKHPHLWEYLAEVFLTWCRRGVDGFRCDAGYKVPMPAWQYITARVRQEFPNAVFLLEGLGGGWLDTEKLLTEGGMQWAYSELFQEFSGQRVAEYLEHALKQSQRVGPLVHFSETHDNNRLAAKGRAWSLMRNRLSALTSVCGGFGFTNGVEWLASEKVRVHGNTGMNWGSKENIVAEMARLNRLLAEHPCFFDGAKLTQLSEAGSPVFALLRESPDRESRVLVLVNTELERPQSVKLPKAALSQGKGSGKIRLDRWTDLLGGPQRIEILAEDKFGVQLPPGGVACFSPEEQPASQPGESYRHGRARAAWALQAMTRVLPAEAVAGFFDWRNEQKAVEENPRRYLADLLRVDAGLLQRDAAGAFRLSRHDSGAYQAVIEWRPTDTNKVTLVPPRHWLLLVCEKPFRATLRIAQGSLPQHVESIKVAQGHVACFAPQVFVGDAELRVGQFAAGFDELIAGIRYLAPEPQSGAGGASHARNGIALLTNGIGGMARLNVDLGAITSKYDCLLAANLHSSLPVDRHVFVKRARVWVNADGFITALNAENLTEFHSGPPARWRFLANAGDGRTVEIFLEAEMVQGENTTRLNFRRGEGNGFPVILTVRVDIEDRNFHWETKRNGGSEHHFASNSRPLTTSGSTGFEFTPAADRQLRVLANCGAYHHEAEWCQGIPHPVEQCRGQEGWGDAYSPGWFELPLKAGEEVQLVVTAELEVQNPRLKAQHSGKRPDEHLAASFENSLAVAARAFVVRRGEGKTVIAGYPWFLDWGRDTLICARGLLAAGMNEEVREILLTFARFEENGTLPNTIHGDNVSNRDTSDAPLWFGMVCEEFAASSRFTVKSSGKRKDTKLHGDLSFYGTTVNASGRTLADVLRSIAIGYLRGTPNGIKVDAGSGLVWSPSHFTWMDTNFPAGTPREGYPVEIQALWIRLLRQLERIGAKPETESWAVLAARAEKSFHELFWLEHQGWFADQLIAKPGVSARQATPDNALRSNLLLAVSLGLVTGERARRCVDAAIRQLVVPGALRSLAPLPVSPPLPVLGNNGQLLNDPVHPYWGRYEGDEDTRRKPAYHNGTAWTWTFPVFCEALARAWDFSPEAVAAARSYLGSVDRLLVEGCLGQLPEIVDGDTPHQQRGCDAQAWGATEALRVWRLLNSSESKTEPRTPSRQRSS
jgi:starch synthase (maltosyl-transferring)